MNTRSALAAILGPPLHTPAAEAFADIQDLRARRALMEIEKAHPRQARELAQTLKRLEANARRNS